MESRRTWSTLSLAPLLALASAGLLALISGCGSPAKPNIILISIDCLNQRQFETAMKQGYAPALEELANDSAVFSRAYAHAPWTTPSHMSMLTGLYPSQHGRNVPYGLMIEWNDFYPRVPSFETMAERLGREGYETAAFVGQGSISAVYGLDQGFDTFEEHRKIHLRWTDLVDVFDATVAWFNDREERPFFLFVHTYDLHGPRPKGLPSDQQTIQYIDQYLSQLIVELKSRGLYDSSLIILTGDHGSNMIELEDKCCVHGAGHYEENLKVPLLLKLPGADERRDESVVARHVDLFPTVMDATGLASDTYDGPGRSLLRERPARSERVVSFSEADGRCSMRRAIVTDRYKYIYTMRDENQALLRQNERFYDDTCPDACDDVPIEELYDLQNDPFEKRNLLAGRTDAEGSERLDELRVEMSRHLNLRPYYSTTVVTGPREGLDDEKNRELLESLRTLGYIR